VDDEEAVEAEADRDLDRRGYADTELDDPFAASSNNFDIEFIQNMGVCLLGIADGKKCLHALVFACEYRRMCMRRRSS